MIKQEWKQATVDEYRSHLLAVLVKARTMISTLLPILEQELQYCKESFVTAQSEYDALKSSYPTRRGNTLQRWKSDMRSAWNKLLHVTYPYEKRQRANEDAAWLLDTLAKAQTTVSDPQASIDDMWKACHELLSSYRVFLMQVSGFDPEIADVIGKVPQANELRGKHLVVPP